MKKGMQAVIPTVCFGAGFLLCVLLAPIFQGVADGESYFSAMADGSFWEIFINNSLMCCLFILGCGIGSSILLLIQGLSFGSLYILWIALGNTAKDFALLFLPHVFFELIAMVLAGYLGFRLLSFVLKKDGQTFKGLVRENRWFLVATFATVLVGALVECYVTPMLYTIV